MGPFDGVRIVDLTTMISGPFATMLLGDQGADVIKIERPDGGDEMRHWGRQNGPFSAPFVNNNRNKRSITYEARLALNADRPAEPNNITLMEYYTLLSGKCRNR